ncbi:hypothetical protein EYC80_007044 [Monilinia laxa]|uniref:Uncharacterized protein n=1 Tax=Monilinia laxa TaxID=61186 RepID=A0A5N6K069_MONLA|nr:hypothetical protein EYC80_007044 [Monilinia laxa]
MQRLYLEPKQYQPDGNRNNRSFSPSNNGPTRRRSLSSHDQPHDHIIANDGFMTSQQNFARSIPDYQQFAADSM